MRIRASCSLAFLLLAGLVRAAEPAGRMIDDAWDAAYLNGAKAGFVRTTVREIARDGQKLLRTTMVLDLTVRRFQDTARMSVETGTEETQEGKVTGVFMKQSLGKQQQLVLTGTVVKENLLHVKVEGSSKIDKKIPWNAQVVGLYREQQLFKDRQAKPGDTFSYLHYEPLVNSVVTVRVAVKDYEEIKDAKGASRQSSKLLRAEATPDKLQYQVEPGKVGSLQLPTSVYWLDKGFTVVRSQVEMEGLGKLTLVRTTPEIAQARATVPARATDIGLTNSIRLNRRIPRPHDTESVVFRVTLPKDDDPASAFARDARQEVKNVKGKTFELHVRAIREPATSDKPSKVDAQYLKSNYFINSADAKVREHARRAVGPETDPWKKAQLIEKWVHSHMKVQNFSEAMATADHVARTLEGDCTEYAMLAAAMCRAVGVPSRIAVGLVIANMRQGPMLAYHMWTEVWIQGQWIAIDATLGQGSVGAAHLKITDHSWHDTQSLVPLLPVTRVMQGKPTIEVIRVNDED